jgi:protein-arginine kinase activator protein McsA
VLEFLLELFLEFLGFLGFRKKKKKENNSISMRANDSTSNQKTSNGVAQENSAVCSGCQRLLQKDAIRELEKFWCAECYKTHILKMKS